LRRPNPKLPHQQSNRASDDSRAQYRCWETRAIQSDYEFIECPCARECWCRRNGCNGHYQIRDIGFVDFLQTYVNLWIPLGARENLKRAVLTRAPFQQRQKNAIEPLRNPLSGGADQQ
jgi:hypothetical protein